MLRTTLFRQAGFGVLSVLTLAAVACKNNNIGNQATGASTPSSAASAIAANAPRSSIPTVVRTPFPVASAEAIGTVLASPAALAAAGAQRLVEIATDDRYSQTHFTVKAGQAVALTLTNNGQAIHNWHLLNAKDQNRKDILTPLLNPGQSATINFTLTTPGVYHFQCDVQPTEMTGTLTVQ